MSYVMPEFKELILFFHAVVFPFFSSDRCVSRGQ